MIGAGADADYLWGVETGPMDEDAMAGVVEEDVGRIKSSDTERGRR